MTPWTIRPPTQADAPYIVQTYVRDAASCLSREEHARVDWRSCAERFVAQHLDAERCLVAGHEGSDTVLGYVLHDGGGVVHWVYTKSVFKRRGVARSLVDAACGGSPVVAVTHVAKKWQRDRIRAARVRVCERLAWLLLIGETNGNEEPSEEEDRAQGQAARG